MIEFDTCRTDVVVCPYCGHKHKDCWEFPDSGDVDCEECEKQFWMERVYDVTYYTRLPKKTGCGDCDHCLGGRPDQCAAKEPIKDK